MIVVILHIRKTQTADTYHMYRHNDTYGSVQVKGRVMPYPCRFGNLPRLDENMERKNDRTARAAVIGDVRDDASDQLPRRQFRYGDQHTILQICRFSRENQQVIQKVVGEDPILGLESRLH